MPSKKAYCRVTAENSGVLYTTITNTLYSKLNKFLSEIKERQREVCTYGPEVTPGWFRFALHVDLLIKLTCVPYRVQITRFLETPSLESSIDTVARLVYEGADEEWVPQFSILYVRDKIGRKYANVSKTPLSVEANLLLALLLLGQLRGSQNGRFRRYVFGEGAQPLNTQVSSTLKDILTALGKPTKICTEAKPLRHHDTRALFFYHMGRQVGFESRALQDMSFAARNSAKMILTKYTPDMVQHARVSPLSLRQPTAGVAPAGKLTSELLEILTVQCLQQLHHFILRTYDQSGGDLQRVPELKSTRTCDATLDAYLPLPDKKSCADKSAPEKKPRRALLTAIYRAQSQLHHLPNAQYRTDVLQQLKRYVICTEVSLDRLGRYIHTIFMKQILSSADFQEREAVELWSKMLNVESADSFPVPPWFGAPPVVALAALLQTKSRALEDVVYVGVDTSPKCTASVAATFRYRVAYESLGGWVVLVEPVLKQNVMYTGSRPVAVPGWERTTVNSLVKNLEDLKRRNSKCRLGVEKYLKAQSNLSGDQTLATKGLVEKVEQATQTKAVLVHPRQATRTLHLHNSTQPCALCVVYFPPSTVYVSVGRYSAFRVDRLVAQLNFRTAAKKIDPDAVPNLYFTPGAHAVTLPEPVKLSTSLALDSHRNSQCTHLGKFNYSSKVKVHYAETAVPHGSEVSVGALNGSLKWSQCVAVPTAGALPPDTWTCYTFEAKKQIRHECKQKNWPARLEAQKAAGEMKYPDKIKAFELAFPQFAHWVTEGASSHPKSDVLDALAVAHSLYLQDLFQPDLVW
jgi:hypothetical protein